MANFKPAQFEQFLRNRDSAIKAFLIFGQDRGRVRESASKLVASVAGDLNDSFNITRLDDDTLAKDPARLADEAQAISMMGGDRVVWVRDAGNGFQAAFKSYSENPVGDALIVAEAGNLRKGTSLRNLFEKARNAAALPCYEDSHTDIHRVIEEQFSQFDLRITNDARMLLVSVLGGDRALTRSEIEKLSLYCQGQGKVEISDVEAVCGDTSALTMDQMLDAVFSGDLAGADKQFSRLMQSGVIASSTISAASNHLIRLQHMAIEVQSGKPTRQVVDATRPPIFWKRKNAFARQLQIWDPESLQAASHTLSEAELKSREMADLANAIVSRAFISISRRARNMSLHGG
ncbi:MAG: DNA polymerase III subunit delta [Hyphomicrobiales bacterium]